MLRAWKDRLGLVMAAVVGCVCTSPNKQQVTLSTAYGPTKLWWSMLQSFAYRQARAPAPLMNLLARDRRLAILKKRPTL